LRRILDKVPAGQAAHGFRRQRSILTNARFHVGQPLVVRLDIKDFFPTITWPRVFGLFRGLGHDRPTAGMLANLCTHQGVLPQGAPTSPAISNLVCLRLDARLLALACKAGGRYTRYADDMTFSGPLEIKGILPTVRKIVAEEGFQVASEKTRLARRCRQQLVTGLVVNERPNVPRRRRRLIRAIVHNAARQGLASQNRQNHPHFAAWLAGWVRFIRMVNPAHGDALLRKLGQVRP
jgi:retron-type reverse transcriptase